MSTPARISIGRAGVRYATADWLTFRSDHAAARDAIFHETDAARFAHLNPAVLQTRATNRHTYLLRPDLGRRLSPDSEQRCREQCRPGAVMQIVIMGGLSGIAVEANALDFLASFHPALQAEGFAGSTGTLLFVHLGRVALMDHIGEILQPDLIIELVGERPGLTTAESLSAYFGYRPRLGMRESDRSLISGIHTGGIPPVEAGAHAARLAARILAAGVSGVKLGL
jgi:ethanolamine ammonia-lyase small subunit